MKLKRSILLSFLLLSLNVLLAQNLNMPTKRDDGSLGKLRFGISADTVQWMVSRPIDNWFISGSFGAKTYIGNEAVSSARWNGLMSVTDIELFKWVIPDVAVGLSFSGFNIKSQTRTENPYIDFTNVARDEDGNFLYQDFSFRYFALNGEVMLDFTNFIKGYYVGNNFRKLHFLGVVGLGFARGTGELKSKAVSWYTDRDPINGTPIQPINFELSALAGLNCRYTVGPRISLNLTGKWMFVRRSFDYSVETEYRFDMIPSLTAGVTIGIMKNFYHEFLPVEISMEEMADLAAKYADEKEILEREIDSIRVQTVADVAEVDSLRRKNDEIQGRLDSLNTAMSVANNPIATILADISDQGLLSAHIFFELDKFDLTDRSDFILKSLSRTIKSALPDERFLIISAADSRTGSVQHNKWLSQKRSESVFDRLVKYGINPNNLQRINLGGIEDYEPFELNRMVIVVIDNPRIMDIIEGELPSFNRNRGYY